jgi:hypothetical protein
MHMLPTYDCQIAELEKQLIFPSNCGRRVKHRQTGKKWQRANGLSKCEATPSFTYAAELLDYSHVPVLGFLG